MGGVRHNDFFSGISLFRQMSANQHQSRELALSAGRRLQAHMFHSAYFAQDVLKLVKQLDGSLQQLNRSQRVDERKSRETRHDFVDLWIVLHRTRP